jgi:streptogramin lyase
MKQFGSFGTFTSTGAFFNNPSGIAVDGSGSIYVADTFNHRIGVYGSLGSTTIIQFGTYGTGLNQLVAPSGIAIDAQKNIYTTDFSSNFVKEFSPTGTEIRVFGTPGNALGQFNYPNGIAIDGSGSIYVADTNNFRVEKFTASGTPVAQFGTSSYFWYPQGIAFDKSGYIYVANTGGNNIMKFMPGTSTIDTLDSPTFDTGVASGVQFNSIGWQGSQGVGSTVQFQLAVSNSSSGPWNTANFWGTDGTSNTYYTPTGPGSPITLNYATFKGYRYFRYRVTIGYLNGVSSRIDDVIVNWSP